MSISSGGYILAGGRLWLDFVNSDDARRARGHDALRTFGSALRWMEAAGMLDADRTWAMRRRADQQPAGALAILGEARRLRAVLRGLAEQGATQEAARETARREINRVLGRSVGVRRVARGEPGGYVRTFAPTGDVFATLLIPLVDSAADALVEGELERVRRCPGAGCARVFLDDTRNARRRWCDMTGCGNRAKAARRRAAGPA